MSKYEILKQFRTVEEVQADWELEQHKDGECGGDCHLCRTLCACGHDLDDEHRLIESRVYDGIIVSRICDICDVDCHVLIGEKEAYEAKCAEERNPMTRDEFDRLKSNGEFECPDCGGRNTNPCGGCGCPLSETVYGTMHINKYHHRCPAEINAKALPKVEAEVKKYLKGQK